MNDNGIGPIPRFLVRDTRTTRRAPNKKASWRQTKGMKEATKRARKVRELEAAFGPVFEAVRSGADTLGKIHKLTGTDKLIIKAALNHYIGGKMRRVGKRYFLETTC